MRDVSVFTGDKLSLSTEARLTLNSAGVRIETAPVVRLIAHEFVQHVDTLLSKRFGELRGIRRRHVPISPPQHRPRNRLGRRPLQSARLDRRAA